MRTISLSLNGKVSIEDVIEVAEDRAAVVLEAQTAEELDRRKKEVDAYVVASGAPAYGFNRGFGHNVHLPVKDEDLEALQLNLIRSHACGVGEPAPTPIVRATMLLRARSLARGHSGVRAAVVQQLLQFLNKGLTPVVPRLGSVSASGDLAPLSHIALALLGEGWILPRGQQQPLAASDALTQAQLAPLKLKMKEGLALNNGAQFSTALTIYCLFRLDRLLETACLTTALSAQVMLGTDTAYRQDLHDLRQHPGAEKTARWIFEFMANSPIREFHRNHNVDGEVQDPYNLRCAAQVLGACWELLDKARATLTIEANSVTDNPVILRATAAHGFAPPDHGKFIDIVSGGHFHGMPVAIEAYGLMQAMAIMARLSNMRCARYVDAKRNKGLGDDLKWPGPLAPSADDHHHQAISSAMMIPEYTSAGLTNWLFGQAMPSHLFSLSTDAGQEDHVSMAANVALRVYDSLERLAEVLAIELAFASQAAAIRQHMDHIPSLAPGKKEAPWDPEHRCLNGPGEAALEAIRAVFPIVKEDRYMADELKQLARRVLDGTILRSARPDGL